MVIGTEVFSGIGTRFRLCEVGLDEVSPAKAPVPRFFVGSYGPREGREQYPGCTELPVGRFSSTICTVSTGAGSRALSHHGNVVLARGLGHQAGRRAPETSHPPQGELDPRSHDTRTSRPGTSSQSQLLTNPYAHSL